MVKKHKVVAHDRPEPRDFSGATQLDRCTDVHSLFGMHEEVNAGELLKILVANRENRCDVNSKTTRKSRAENVNFDFFNKKNTPRERHLREKSFGATFACRRGDGANFRAPRNFCLGGARAG